jgi:hypothetical protein
MSDIRNTDSREEREISINRGSKEDAWQVWTNDTIYDRKLRKIGATVTREYTRRVDGETWVTAREYELDGAMVSFRKKRVMTEAQKQAARERIKKVQAANRARAAKAGK